jgi:hypothetical protein
MRITPRRTASLLTPAVLMLLTVMAHAADPGIPFPASSEISDQTPGSVLFYNYYTSSASAPNTRNTRINITNTCSPGPAVVHIFFVDGASCSVADTFVCLTANQTASFLASDVDPGVTGYIVVVSVDPITGCPTNNNCLIGDEYAKTGGDQEDARVPASSDKSGQMTEFPRVCPPCSQSSETAVLLFDGNCYGRLPRVLGLSSIPDRASGNETLLVINRIGGNLATGVARIGPIFGLLFDDAENSHSFTFKANSCQLVGSLSNSFPRTTPRFESVIPAGRSGWMKFWSPDEVGLLGMVINFNSNAGTAVNAFNGARNLHQLTLATSVSLTIPVFPPSC